MIASYSRNRRLFITFAASSLLVTSGSPSCYTPGLRFGASGKRIAVPVFGNNTYVRGIEMEITESIRRILLERGDVQLVGTREEAEVVIEGTVLRCNFPVLVGGRDPRILEGSSWMTVEARLINPKSNGPALASVRGDDRAEFTTPLGETRTTSLRELTTELAWKIVNGLSQQATLDATPSKGSKAQ